MKFGTLFACSVGVVAAIAADSFGGIGLVLLENRNGIVVKNIVPGTPAANADLNVGDRIISVDGEFLQQKSLENILPLFRGADNKPIELIYVRDGDTLQTTLRRTILTTRDVPVLGDSAYKLEGKKQVFAYVMENENYKLIFIEDSSKSEISNENGVNVKKGGFRVLDIRENFIRVEKKFSGRVFFSDLNGRMNSKNFGK